MADDERPTSHQNINGIAVEGLCDNSAPLPWRARRMAVTEFGTPVRAASTKVPSTGCGNQFCPRAVADLTRPMLPAMIKQIAGTIQSTGFHDVTFTSPPDSCF